MSCAAACQPKAPRQNRKSRVFLRSFSTSVDYPKTKDLWQFASLTAEYGARRRARTSGFGPCHWRGFIPSSKAWRGKSDCIPVSYRFPDRFKYGLDVVMNDSILESNNLYSQFRQKCGTPSLIFCSKFSEMWRAVQLNGDAAFDAEKVDNVATYAELSPELLSQKASPLKVLP